MALPKPGQVVELDDEDYYYGDGHLVFSVAEVLGEPYHMGDVIWVKLRGYRVHPGQPFGPERTISAKVNRIKLAPTQGDPLPSKPPADQAHERIPTS